jgi:hypothetical protein
MTARIEYPCPFAIYAIRYPRYDLRAATHEFDEIVEEVARIVGAGGGFGMVLDEEALV